MLAIMLDMQKWTVVDHNYIGEVHGMETTTASIQFTSVEYDTVPDT